MENLRRLHRRFAVLMGLSALTAYAGGAGFTNLSTMIAAGTLAIAFLWQPSSTVSRYLEGPWLVLAAILAIRAFGHIFFQGGDVVQPVVDLLLLLLCVESLRPLGAVNGARIYALAFTLLLAATAFRPGLVYGVAFIAFTLFATLGMSLGHLRRKAETHEAFDIRLRRSTLTAMSALSLLVVFSGVLVFLVFPRVSSGRGGTSVAPATSMVGFSDQVTIGTHGSRIVGNPEVVLRVEFPDGRPQNLESLYWRGRSYDHFDGTRWSRTRNAFQIRRFVRWYGLSWTSDDIEQVIYATPLKQKVLFALHPTVGIRPSSRISPTLDSSGDILYWGSGNPRYSAFSRRRLPSPDRLRAAGVERSDDLSAYLQLPELGPGIQALADSLTRDIPSIYDKAKAIERWFHTEFAYTLELPATAQESTLDHFLLVRRTGHCEYFSTAMVVLLRSLGVPAREVNGFLGGQWNDSGDYLAVTQNQAHSWVEVWFPEYGWIPFDPTPSGSATESLGSAWLWPGRFFLDGLQHRWNKWVLDFGAQDQMNMLSGLSDLASGETSGVPGAVGNLKTFWNAVSWVPVIAILLTLTSLYVLFKREKESYETRAYLRLRNQCRLEGLLDSSEVTPEALLESIRGKDRSASIYANRVIRLYLKARFGGAALDPDERKELARALTSTLRSLRLARS